MYSSRGFGDLGSTKKKEELKEMNIPSNISRKPAHVPFRYKSNYDDDTTSSDEDERDEQLEKEKQAEEEPKMLPCPNC
jgi:hypothetical protein